MTLSSLNNENSINYNKTKPRVKIQFYMHLVEVIMFTKLLDFNMSPVVLPNFMAFPGCSNLR